jgi:putative membrane protein
LKWGAILGTAAGLALSAWLLASFGIWRIVDLLGHAGLGGILLVTAFHLIQILFSALAWRAIMGPSLTRPGLGRYMILRWIREAVNNLLPVAQIGGEFVVSRLLTRQGVKLRVAIAGTVADLTMEMVTQIAFTLLGLALLLHGKADTRIAGAVGGFILVAAAVAALSLGAQWFGLAALIERGLLRLGRSMGWAGPSRLEGLHQALLDCYRARRRVALAATWQMIAWLLGGVEVCLALHFLGSDVGIAAGLVIESIGQALKSVGFAVPGALGVQEGGYIVICGAYGLPAETGIALSLMKRVREILLGVPALMVWQREEGRTSFLKERSKRLLSVSAAVFPDSAAPE